MILPHPPSLPRHGPGILTSLSEQELGKPIGSDAQEQKNTYVSLCGMGVCAQRIERLSAYAKQLLRENFVDTAFLCELVDSLAERTN